MRTKEMIVLTREDFDAAEAYAKEAAEEAGQLVVVSTIAKAAFIAGLNYATIRAEKERKNGKARSRGN